MEPENRRKLSDQPIVVWLGIISSLIAIFVFITGYQTLSNLFGKATAIPRADPTSRSVILPTSVAYSPTETLMTIVSTREPHIVLPRCLCDEMIAADEPVVIRVRWGAKSQELAEQGANLIVFHVTVDGASIGDLSKYRKPAVFVAGPAPISGETDFWWVYWDYPLGHLTEGIYSIEADAVATADIYDGLSVTPAGTELPSRVELNVVLP
jgi:hypothetical protein